MIWAKRGVSVLLLTALIAMGVSQAGGTDAGQKKEEGKAAKIEKTVAEDAKKAWHAVKKTGRRVAEKISGPGKKKKGKAKRREDRP